MMNPGIISPCWNTLGARRVIRLVGLPPQPLNRGGNSYRQQPKQQQTDPNNNKTSQALSHNLKNTLSSSQQGEMRPNLKKVKVKRPQRANDGMVSGEISHFTHRNL